jgi:hypothetical protein
MADSQDIDNALLAKLGADTALLALLPNGPYWDNEAAADVVAYVRVSLADSVDGLRLGGRGYESHIYLIRAIVYSGVADAKTRAKQAAARIDELLDPQPPNPPATLTVAGYTSMAIYREPTLQRIHDTQPASEVDPSIQWYMRGAHYRVVQSLIRA